MSVIQTSSQTVTNAWKRTIFDVVPCGHELGFQAIHFIGFSRVFSEAVRRWAVAVVVSGLSWGLVLISAAAHYVLNTTGRHRVHGSGWIQQHYRRTSAWNRETEREDMVWELPSFLGKTAVLYNTLWFSELKPFLSPKKAYKLQKCLVLNMKSDFWHQEHWSINMHIYIINL